MSSGSKVEETFTCDEKEGWQIVNRSKKNKAHITQNKPKTTGKRQKTIFDGIISPTSNDMS